MSRLGRPAGLLASVTLLLGACAGPAADGEAGTPSPAEPLVTVAEPEPRRVDEPLPESGLDPAALPLPMAAQTVLEPGWDTLPETAGGYFLGVAEGEGVLEMRAVGPDGSLRWVAERPASCSSFALSVVDGRPVAVLANLEPDEDAVAGTTASAYDLDTGELLWGPVEVPGPHQGPGTVFAEPAAAMGETGPRTALDPATGEVLATESDDLRVVAERDGTLLTARDGQLVAERDGEEVWRAPLSGDLPADPVATPGTRPPAGTLLLGPAPGTLVDVEDGAVLATGAADARRDPAADTLLVRTAEGVDGLGPEEWTRALPEDARLAGAGGALVYLRVGDAVQALNALTGAEAIVYGDVPEDGLAVPEIVTADGTAVLATGLGPVLVTPTTAR